MIRKTLYSSTYYSYKHFAVSAFLFWLFYLVYVYNFCKAENNHKRISWTLSSQTMQIFPVNSFYYLRYNNKECFIRSNIYNKFAIIKRSYYYPAVYAREFFGKSALPPLSTLECRQLSPIRHPSSGQRGPKWKALSTLSGRVQVLLHQSTIASRSCYRSKCAAGCALIRGRQPKPPSELERAVTGTGRGVAGRKTLVPPVLLLSVDVDAARWRERQLGSRRVLQCDGCLRNEAAVPRWNVWAGGESGSKE